MTSKDGCVTPYLCYVRYTFDATPYLCYVGYTFDAETLEDEGDGLDHHRVMLRQRQVLDDAQQCCYGNGRVELLKGCRVHVHEHLTRAVLACHQMAAPSQILCEIQTF